MEIRGDRRHHSTMQAGWFRMKKREHRQHSSFPLTTPTTTTTTTLFIAHSHTIIIFSEYEELIIQQARNETQF
jgi:hypothetical protein